MNYLWILTLNLVVDLHDGDAGEGQEARDQAEERHPQGPDVRRLPRPSVSARPRCRQTLGRSEGGRPRRRRQHRVDSVKLVAYTEVGDLHLAIVRS